MGLWHHSRQVQKLVVIYLRQSIRANYFTPILFFVICTCVTIYAYYGWSFEHNSTLRLSSIPPSLLVNVFGPVIITVITLANLVSTREWSHFTTNYSEKLTPLLVRPITDLTFTIAQFTQVVIQIWTTFVIWILIVQAIGVIGESQSPRILQFIELRSLCEFVLVDASIYCAMVAAIIIFLNRMSKSWMLTTIVLVSILAVQVFALTNIPPKDFGLYTLFPRFGDVASEIIPIDSQPEILFFRIMNLFVALSIAGLLCCTNSRVRRNKHSVVQYCALFVLALSIAVRLWYGFTDDNASNPAYHKNTTGPNVANKARSALILSDINGTLRIVPKEVIAYQLEFTLQTSRDIDIAQLRLQLNPGLRIEGVTVDGIGEEYFHTAEGLVVAFGRSLESSQEVRVMLNVTGALDVTRARTEQTYVVSNLSYSRSRIHALGESDSIFERNYVALLHGVAWLPHFQYSTETSRSKFTEVFNFFRYSVVAELPVGWIVATSGAMPGSQSIGHEGFVDLHSTGPHRTLALIMAPFTRISDEVEGIGIELLLYKKNTEFMKSLGKDYLAYKTYIKERIIRLRETNFDANLEFLTIVEVPISLRAYSLDFSLGSTQSHSHIYLIREHDFTMANFERFRVNRVKDGDDMSAEAMAFHIASYLDGSKHSESLIEHIAKRHFYNNICIEGEGANLLTMLLHEVVYAIVRSSVHRVSTEKYFLSQYFRSDDSLGGLPSRYSFIQRMNFLFGGMTKDLYGVGRWDHPQVWALIIQGNWNDIVQLSHGEPYNLALAKSIDSVKNVLLSKHSMQQLTELVAGILTEGKNGCLDKETVFDIASGFGVPLNLMYGSLFGDGLPRFDVSRAEVLELIDSESEYRYSISVDTRNNSGVSGYVYFRMDLPLEDRFGNVWIEPVFSDVTHVPAESSVRFGMMSDRDPLYVWIVPVSLSENRFATLASIDRQTSGSRDAELASVGPVRSDWKPLPQTGIVVDDLSSDVNVVRIGNTGERSVSGDSPVNCKDIAVDWTEISRGIWCRLDYEHRCPVVQTRL